LVRELSSHNGSLNSEGRELSCPEVGEGSLGQEEKCPAYEKGRKGKKNGVLPRWVKKGKVYLPRRIGSIATRREKKTTWLRRIL